MLFFQLIAITDFDTPWIQLSKISRICGPGYTVVSSLKITSGNNRLRSLWAYSHQCIDRLQIWCFLPFSLIVIFFAYTDYGSCAFSPLSADGENEKCIGQIKD